MVPMQIWDVLSTIGAPFSPHSSHVAWGQSVHHSSQPRRKNPIETKKRRIGLLGKLSEWVKAMGFHMLNMLNTPTPQRRSGVFWGWNFLGCRFVFYLFFFCNLALELIWWIFLSEKMGLALLNMDFTEQMGICGVLDLEVEVFFIVFCWMSFFQWVSGLAGFGR